MHDITCMHDQSIQVFIAVQRNICLFQGAIQSGACQSVASMCPICLLSEKSVCVFSKMLLITNHVKSTHFNVNAVHRMSKFAKMHVTLCATRNFEGKSCVGLLLQEEYTVRE